MLSRPPRLVERRHREQTKAMGEARRRALKKETRDGKPCSSSGQPGCPWDGNQEGARWCQAEGTSNSTSPASLLLPYEHPEGEVPGAPHLTTAWEHPRGAPVPQPSAGGASWCPPPGSGRLPSRTQPLQEGWLRHLQTTTQQLQRTELCPGQPDLTEECSTAGQSSFLGAKQLKTGVM